MSEKTVTTATVEKTDTRRNGSVELCLPEITPEMREKIEAKYTKDPKLAFCVGKILKGKRNGDQTDLERNPDVEAQLPQELAETAKTIADANYQELFRATAAKWYVSLTELFKDAKVSRIPIHEKDRPVRILIPGAHFGAEIGGILDWFNDQGIKVEITTVDKREIENVEEYRKYLDLERRQSICGSKVNFLTDDVIDFAKDKEFDMVMFRHPGPIFHTDQQEVWKKIFDSCLGTKPFVVILSTYNEVIDDPLASGSLIEEVKEGDIFDQWFGENRFWAESQEEDRQHELCSPYSIYMVPRKIGGKPEVIQTIDKLMRLYIGEKVDL